MFLEQYNSLMGSMLNQQCTLAKLRAEIEGREGRVCWSCKGFGHLARNCRNKAEKEKRGVTLQNKFKVLSSRVMQCGVKERIVRKLEAIEAECFKCGEGTQVQRVSPLERREEVASGKRGGACDHATKGTARRMEEESSTCLMTKSTGALRRGHSREGMPVGAGVAYKGSNSIVYGV